MSSSTIDPAIPRLTPSFPPSTAQRKESPTVQAWIDTLGLVVHTEGGYFAEIDRDPLTVPNPFLGDEKEEGVGEGERDATASLPFSGNNAIRNASTSIYYLLTPTSPQGHFHRNKGRTVHTLISGRGRYVLIHADEPGNKKRVETFIVGKDVANGEKPVWVVEGGKFKASFLLESGTGEEDALLISETVVPGFEYSDHDFLKREKFVDLVTGEQAQELVWLVRKV